MDEIDENSQDDINTINNDQTESSSEENTVFTQLKFFNSGFKAHKSQEELLMEAIKENKFFLIKLSKDACVSVA